jgi:hypothetical protein
MNPELERRVRLAARSLVFHPDRPLTPWRERARHTLLERGVRRGVEVNGGDRVEDEKSFIQSGFQVRKKPRGRIGEGAGLEPRALAHLQELPHRTVQARETLDIVGPDARLEPQAVPRPRDAPRRKVEPGAREHRMRPAVPSGGRLRGCAVLPAEPAGVRQVVADEVQPSRSAELDEVERQPARAERGGGGKQPRNAAPDLVGLDARGGETPPEGPRRAREEGARGRAGIAAEAAAARIDRGELRRAAPERPIVHACEQQVRRFPADGEGAPAPRALRRAEPRRLGVGIGLQPGEDRGVQRRAAVAVGALSGQGTQQQRALHAPTISAFQALGDALRSTVV